MIPPFTVLVDAYTVAGSDSVIERVDVGAMKDSALARGSNPIVLRRAGSATDARRFVSRFPAAINRTIGGVRRQRIFRRACSAGVRSRRPGVRSRLDSGAVGEHAQVRHG